MTQKFANAASAELAMSIAAVDTTITIDAAREYLFPTANTGTGSVPASSDWFKVVLQDVNGNIEVAYVRTRASGSASLMDVLRGQESTTARAFASGSIVGVRATAADFDKAITRPASEVAVTPVGGIAATTVQAALAELDSEKAATGHTQAASTVTVTPTGNLASTDVQAALAELDSEKIPSSAIGTTVQAFDAATAKTNQAQQFTAPQRTDPLADNDLSFDISAKQDFVCTPTAGGTLTFVNITAGCKGEILLVNGSNYTIAKAATVKCPSSMLPAISATGRYRLAYSCLDGTNVDVTASGALA